MGFNVKRISNKAHEIVKFVTNNLFLRGPKTSAAQASALTSVSFLRPCPALGDFAHALPPGRNEQGFALATHSMSLVKQGLQTALCAER
jgi:hypothetical protein